MQNRRRLLLPVVFKWLCTWMRKCHLRTRERIRSVFSCAHCGPTMQCYSDKQTRDYHTDLGIARPGRLVLALLREADAEESQAVAVGRLHVHMSLDEGLPLAHQRANLVCCEGHAPEVGEACPALHFLHLEPHLPEGVVFILHPTRLVSRRVCRWQWSA